MNLENYSRTITREEAIVMIQRALVPISETTSTHNYIDFEDVSVWSKDSMET